MVTIAPELPSVTPPEWLRESRPISDLSVDKSAAIGITTGAQALETGVNVAENLQQKAISDKTRAGVDAIRDTTTLAYENIRNAQLSGQSPADAAMRTAGFTGSLTGSQPDVPPGLQAGLDRADQIGTAMAQGAGKNNDTLYTANLNALAKQLRSEYPGHRDFVDEQIARISGKNPANAYMDNLLQDINRNATAANAGKNRLLGEAYKYFGADDGSGRTMWPYIKAFEMGLPNSENNLANAVSKAAADKYKFDSWQQNHTMNTANKADDTETAKQQYAAELGASAQRHFNGLLEVPGLTDPATIQRLISQSQNGQIVLSSDQKNQLLSAAVAAKSAWEDDAKRIANQRGYTARINDPKSEASIKDNEGQFFTRLIDNIQNDKYGSLFENKRAVEGIRSDSNKQLLTDPNVGGYTRLIDSMTQFAGPNWVNTAQAAGLQKGYLGKFQNFVNQSLYVAATPDDLRQDGKVKSMYDHIHQLQQAGATIGPDGQPTKVPQKAYDDVVHNVDKIADPGTPPQVKTEIAKYAFNEQNWKLMDAFKMDFTDSKGVQHKGKYSVFDTLTQPGITDNLWNLKDKSVWGMYKNWADTSFSTLYREDLDHLSQMSTRAPSAERPFRILWDSRNSRFDTDNGKGQPYSPTTTVDANFFNEVRATLNRVNNGVYNLKNVYAKEGEDTSEKMLQRMIQMGFKPNESVGGLPDDMMKAIISSKEKRDLGTAFEKARKPNG